MNDVNLIKHFILAQDVLQAGKYVGIGAVLGAFVVIILLTVYLIVR